jgi:hypothetical protein
MIGGCALTVHCVAMTVQCIVHYCGKLRITTELQNCILRTVELCNDLGLLCSTREKCGKGYLPIRDRGWWWNLSRRGSVRKHPSMQHLAPGLCLEQTPKPIFGPCYGASRPLLYARPIPFVISLPLSYSSAMSHSPILTIHLTQACPTQMDTRPHYPYHAPLTIIANATHFGTLL